MVASILKIVIIRNTICDNLVGFPKSGHILHGYTYLHYCIAALPSFTRFLTDVVNSDTLSPTLSFIPNRAMW